MNLDIRMKTSRPSPILRAFAEDELAKRLGAHADYVERAIVRIEDENGPRGGEDKVCRATIRLGKLGTVVVEHRAGDWYEAVAETAASAGRLARNTIERRRKRRPPVAPRALRNF